jgi:hypothetical protein
MINTIQFNFEETHQIIDRYGESPQKETTWRITAHYVPLALKDSIVEMLKKEQESQLIESTKKYEQEKRQTEEKKRTPFFERFGLFNTAEREVDIRGNI